MDLVTRNLLESFRSSEALSSNMANDVLFEHFSNFCVVSSEYQETFDIQDVHVGGGNDLQIDGVAIIVNGSLVTSTEEVDDLLNINKQIDAEFIFIQAKSGDNFYGAEISNFFFGIRDIFADEPKLPRGPKLSEKEAVLKHIYTKSAHFRRGNPELKLYYVTTGTWQDDPQLTARVNAEISTLDELNIFTSPPQFIPVDARILQQLHNRSQSVYTATVDFSNRVTLPLVDGVRESYLGYLPVSRYLDAITDDEGNLIRGLFYENVRDYQGENDVNKEINQTLQQEGGKSFILLNNGVTLVADDLHPTGDQFTITGLQVVNGCQTSHVLFNNQENLHDDAAIPVKLVVAPDEEVKNQVIKATNRQTNVKTEDLTALTDFQKHLEQYYADVPDEHRLYYERRSQQYRAAGIEKIRVVSISTQIRAFSSMFLGRAHQASRYYGTLLKEIEKRIFVESHDPIGYYVSAYALFLLDSYLRKGEIDNSYRQFRYHILHAFRHLVIGKHVLQLNSREFRRECERLKEVLWGDPAQRRIYMQRAASYFDDEFNEVQGRDVAKDSGLQGRIEAKIAASEGDQ